MYRRKQTKYPRRLEPKLPVKPPENIADKGHASACLRALLASAICWTALPRDCFAQIPRDQITIAIPAVQRGSSDINDLDAALMSYIVGQSITRYFMLTEETTHRSALVAIPAPLNNTRPKSISAFARINGAQIAIILKAFRQLDGALINTVVAIPDTYEDYRTRPVELLHLRFEDKHLSLDIPSKYVVFNNLFLSHDTLNTYKNGEYRNWCPIDRCDSEQTPKVTGKCLRLGEDVPFSKVVRYLEIGENSILKSEGVCYLQKWPPERPVAKPVIDFIAGIQRYFAGDWESAKSRMSYVINGVASKKSNITLQGYLYLVRISLQQGNEAGAAEYMQAALSLDAKDAKVAETKRFLSFWLLVRSVNMNSPSSKTQLERLASDLAQEPPFVQRQYREMLDRLRARISKGN